MKHLARLFLPLVGLGAAFFGSQPAALASTTLNGKVLPYNAPSRPCGYLLSNEALTPTQSQLESCGGTYRLDMQTDGNLVWYGPSGALWSSWGAEGCVAPGFVGPTLQPRCDGAAGYLAMQPDGNLVFADPSLNISWQSHTSGSPGAYLVLQTDGNLVIYNAENVAIWASDQGGLIAGCGYLGPNQGWPVNGNLPSCGLGKYTLSIQADGNLVVYNGRIPQWSTGTQGSPLSRLIMQDDGNLVLYGSNNYTALWDSQTFGHPGAYFWFDETAGNLEVLSPSNQLLWSSAWTPNSAAADATLTPVARLGQCGSIYGCGNCTPIVMQLDDKSNPGNVNYPSAVAASARFYIGSLASAGHAPTKYFADAACTIPAEATDVASYNPVYGPTANGQPLPFLPDTSAATGLFGNTGIPNQATVYVESSTIAVNNTVGAIFREASAVGSPGATFTAFRYESGLSNAFPSLEPAAPALPPVHVPPAVSAVPLTYSFTITAAPQLGQAGTGARARSLVTPANVCIEFMATVAGTAAGGQIATYYAGPGAPVTLSATSLPAVNPQLDSPAPTNFELYSDGACSHPIASQEFVNGSSKLVFFMKFPSSISRAFLTFHAFNLTQPYQVTISNPAGLACPEGQFAYPDPLLGLTLCTEPYEPDYIDPDYADLAPAAGPDVTPLFPDYFANGGNVNYELTDDGKVPEQMLLQTPSQLGIIPFEAAPIGDGVGDEDEGE
jgi:hypothetical protein